MTLALLLALGAGGGFVGSRVLGTQPTAAGVPTPVVAQSPAYPVDPLPELVPDNDFPPLATDIPTVRGTVGTGGFTLVFPVPKGWDMTRSSSAETKWYPPNNPGYTYGLRVEQVDGLRVSIPATLADRVEALTAAEDHLKIEDRTSDSLHFTYVTDGRLRHGLLRWLDISGSGHAEVEISVNGREADLPGMEDLMATVVQGVRRQ